MGPDRDWFDHHHRFGGGPGPDAFWLLGPTSVILLGLLVALLWWIAYGQRRLPAERPRPVADPWRARWDAAVERHRRTAEAYAAFECDPEVVLRLPALADVTQPATARFIDAFAEAGALLTERFPPAPHVQQFVAAAERAAAAWAAARDAAVRIRDAGFGTGDRAAIEHIRVLLTIADRSAYEPERESALRHARRRLAALEKHTGWRLPQPAELALAERARPALPAA